VLPRRLMRVQAPVAAEPPPAEGIFPLGIHSSGRYLVDAQGAPFFVHGDTAWSLAVQLTAAEIDTYLDDRQTKGVTAILFNAIEHEFSSQSPAYRNVSGADPFTSMTDFAAPNNTYWTRVDYIVNGALSRDMLCVINPAYFGFQLGSQGWENEIVAESDADLQTYGAWLANRYTQGNVMWCWGGDDDGDATLRAKQRQILTGIRSVRTTDLNTFHPTPDKHALEVVSTADYPNFVNWSYAYEDAGEYPFAQVAQAYAASGPVPVVYFEGRYENENSAPVAMFRRMSYTSLLAGACGQFFGNSPIWHFETPFPPSPFSWSGTWESALNSTGSTEQQYVPDLFLAYQWQKLEPRTDNSLVSSSKGGTTSPVCPALANDGSFAMIYVPNSQTVTLVKSALAPSNLRVRLYDPTAGTYSTHTASTPNTGTLNVATGGERIIVVDAA
jgi:hypothetical protein